MLTLRLSGANTVFALYVAFLVILARFNKLLHLISIFPAKYKETSVGSRILHFTVVLQTLP